MSRKCRYQEAQPSSGTKRKSRKNVKSQTLDTLFLFPEYGDHNARWNKTNLKIEVGA